MLYLASAAAALSASSTRSGAPGRWLAVAFPILVLTIDRAGGAREDRLERSLLDATVEVMATVSLAAMITLALDALIGGVDPVGCAVRLWVSAAVCLGVTRALVLTIRSRAQRAGTLSKPTLIIGAGLVGEHLARRLTNEPRFGLRPVGFLDADPLPRFEASISRTVPVLGGLDDLADAIERTGARHVVLAFSNEPDYVLIEKVRQCEQLGVDVSLVPRMYELVNEGASLGHVGGLPLLSLHSIDPRGWQFAVKHALDRAVALLVLVVLAPLIGIIAVAVRFSSPGSVIFRQRRTGRDGHEFDVLKFRTMRAVSVEAKGWGLAPGGVEAEDRRTRVGRLLRALSLDELPQFINVLHGDMSLVGPRPERPDYVTRFTRDISGDEERHRVKSGITGWAQVHGPRGRTSIADRVEWDNYYIQNWTLRLDFRILVLTLVELLRRRHA